MIHESLSLRIADGLTDRVIPRRAVRSLSWRKVAPGGWASMQLELNEPLASWPTLGPADRVYVTKSSTGQQLMAGYVEQPGRNAGPEGESWDITALGGLSLASDQSRAVVYVDRELSSFERDVLAKVPASAGTSLSTHPKTDDPNGKQGLLLQFVPGQPIGTGALAQMSYTRIEDAGMQVAAITVTAVAGKDDGGYRGHLAWAPPDGTGDIMSSLGILTTPRTNVRYVGYTGSGSDVHPPPGITRVGFGLRRTGGATNVADDNTWLFLYDIAIVGRRMDRYGVLDVDQPEIGSASTVRAHQVAEDVFARFIPQVDPDHLVIVPPADPWPIDQLAYDSTTARSVLDDLARYEPGQHWWIGELLPNGKHRAGYGPWRDDVRYEITRADGYDAPGGEADLANRITVYYTDDTGKPQHETVTSVVPDLDRIRDAESITLPPGVGSKAIAQRLGAEILATKATPPRAATVAIDRRIFDRWIGSWVEPSEIEPGCLVRVVDDGTVDRLTEISYDGVRHQTTGKLGTPTPTADERLARLVERK